MKKTLCLLLFVSVFGYGQNSPDTYNVFSIEGGVGMAVPVSGFSKSGHANGNLALPTLQGGLRYMFNTQFGLLGTLEYQNFKDNANKGVTVFKTGLQGVYNLGHDLSLGRSSREQFGLLTHAGVEIGNMNSNSNSINDYLGSLVIGVKPLINVGDKLSVFADFNYNKNLKLNTFYNGERYMHTINSNQFGVSFGLIFYIGSETSQADFM